MMDLSGTAEDLWRPDELAAMLRHELAAPLPVALGRLGEEAARRMQELGLPADSGMTLGDVLHHACPPVQLLDLTKRFAKLCNTDPDTVLPRDIAQLLYLASITAALTRAGQRISSLSAPSLRLGLEWATRQAWVDDATRALLKEGLEHLGSSRGGESDLPA
jgi:hypothetical protein